MASIVSAINIAQQFANAGGSGGYRPPEWSSQGSTATLTLSVPGQQPNQLQAIATDGGAADDGVDDVPLFSPPTIYVFDAIIRAEHAQELEITKNPVQTGASLTDQAYLQPARLVVEILMSDTMQSFTVGQFSGNPSRSVSAYDTLKAIQVLALQGIFLSVATRIAQYSNMVITSLRPTETKETRFGLKATVEFTQIFVVQNGIGPSSSTAVSTRPQTTNSTLAGILPSVPVALATITQHSVLNAPFGTNLLPAMSVPGAGAFSGVNVSQLSGILGQI